MDKNKEKCRRLKEIRKQTADRIGIDLQQTECTYEGNCSGTCPKCRQEEEKLNMALLGKAAVVLGVGLSLTACTPGSGGDSNELDGDVIMVTEEACTQETTTAGEETTGEETTTEETDSEEVIELEGDIQPISE